MDLGKDWAVCAAQFSRAFGLYSDRDDRRFHGSIVFCDAEDYKK